MKKIWIENREGSFVLHAGEPYLSPKDDEWHSRGWWWIAGFVARAILGGKNLPGLGQVSEVECEFKTYWEAEE